MRVIPVTNPERVPMPRRLTAIAHRKNHEDGFTLVEILVVMLIMGILSAIAIPVFLSQRKNAVDDAIRSDMKNIVQTIDSVRSNNPNARFLVYRAGKVCAGSTAYPSSCSATSPAPVTSSGATFVVSGGSGSSGEYYVSGYHAGANKYTTSNTRLFYSSVTKEFKECPCT